MNNTLPYLLTLGSTLSFSAASLIFAKFAKSVSVIWLNTAKAFIAASLLIITLPVLFWLQGTLAQWTPPNSTSTVLFLLSGFLGLGVGDMFLVDAFIRIGVSRTLMLYGFQPLVIGIAGYFLFDQSFDPQRLIAVIFLIGCLYVFSLEKYKKSKTWEFHGLGIALVGILLDSVGVIITRMAFEDSPTVHPLEGHLLRCLGALLAYAVMAGGIRLLRKSTSPVIGLFSNFTKLDISSKCLVFIGCFFGTYLSLCLYLTAIQIGHLASIAAIVITGPIFAALLESIIEKRLPSKYLNIAFLLFICGFYFLIVN